jgi:dTDP-4-dehydrorhamnose 3,5-epimerase-like enzyme
MEKSKVNDTKNRKKNTWLNFKLMNVKTVYIIDFPSFGDERGVLTSIEQIKNIPIEVKRIFFMHHVTEDRGGHAHIDTDQIIIAISGSLKLKVFNGINEDIYLLNDCTIGIFTPRLTYCDLYDFSPDAVCLVLANTYYDIKMSLRNREDFLKFLNNVND